MKKRYHTGFWSTAIAMSLATGAVVTTPILMHSVTTVRAASVDDHLVGAVNNAARKTVTFSGAVKAGAGSSQTGTRVVNGVKTSGANNLNFSTLALLPKTGINYAGSNYSFSSPQGMTRTSNGDLYVLYDESAGTGSAFVLRLSSSLVNKIGNNAEALWKDSSQLTAALKTNTASLSQKLPYVTHGSLMSSYGNNVYVLAASNAGGTGEKIMRLQGSSAGKATGFSQYAALPTSSPVYKYPNNSNFVMVSDNTAYYVDTSSGSYTLNQLAISNGQLNWSKSAYSMAPVMGAVQGISYVNGKLMYITSNDAWMSFDLAKAVAASDTFVKTGKLPTKGSIDANWTSLHSNMETEQVMADSSHHYLLGIGVNQILVANNNGSAYSRGTATNATTSYKSITKKTNVNYQAVMSTQNGTRNDGLYTSGPCGISANTMRANGSVANGHNNWKMHATEEDILSNGVTYVKVTDQSGRHTWWVDKRALSKVAAASYLKITSTKNVAYTATLSTQNGKRNDGLYVSGPYNTSASTKTPDGTVKGGHDNWQVKVSAEDRVSNGATYAKVTTMDGKHTWWVDKRALAPVATPTYLKITSTKSISYTATLSTQNGKRNDGLYVSGPYNTSASTKTPDGTVKGGHDNWQVKVSAEDRVSNGATYAKVTTMDGKHTWWVDKRALAPVTVVTPAYLHITSTQNVNYSATLSTQNGKRNDGLYLSGPYNTSASTKTPSATVAGGHNNWQVKVSVEDHVSNGATYVKVTTLNGQHTWWVDKRALVNIGYAK